MNAILKYDQANRVGLIAIARTVTALVVVAIVIVVITSLIASRDHAVAESGGAPRTATAPPSAPQVARPVKPLAFGYVEFDWDPAAPDGVPGFDSWPRSTWR